MAAAPPPSVEEVLRLAGIAAGLIVTLGGLVLRFSKDYRERQSGRQKEQGQQDALNIEEARRLRDEAWRMKEEAEEQRDEWRDEASRWQRAFYNLWHSANRIITRCSSVVGTALSFLDDARHEPAKKELSKLETELKEYHLPEAPKAE